MVGFSRFVNTVIRTLAPCATRIGGTPLRLGVGRPAPPKGLLTWPRRSPSQDCGAARREGDPSRGPAR
jgi:hypothetical protein